MNMFNNPGKPVRQICVIGFMMVMLWFVPAWAGGPLKLLSQKEARLVAEQSEEAQALYGLNGGRFVNCLELSVLRPCETDWVTCIEDAWVVRFHFGETCGISHDGRLDLVIVVDAVNGKIISKYPEAPYYRDPFYCINDNDCLEPAESDKPVCHNFIFSQVNGDQPLGSGCQCIESRCVNKASGG